MCGIWGRWRRGSGAAAAVAASPAVRHGDSAFACMAFGCKKQDRHADTVHRNLTRALATRPFPTRHRRLSIIAPLKPTVSPLYYELQLLHSPTRSYTLHTRRGRARQILAGRQNTRKTIRHSAAQRSTARRQRSPTVTHQPSKRDISSERASRQARGR